MFSSVLINYIIPPHKGAAVMVVYIFVILAFVVTELPKFKTLIIITSLLYIGSYILLDNYKKIFKDLDSKIVKEFMTQSSNDINENELDNFIKYSNI